MDLAKARCLQDGLMSDESNENSDKGKIGRASDSGGRKRDMLYAAQERHGSNEICDP